MKEKKKVGLLEEPKGDKMAEKWAASMDIYLAKPLAVQPVDPMVGSSAARKDGTMAGSMAG
jgi:hypothetical protein